MIDELEVEAGPLARWQVHWCDPRREVSWYAADPVLASLPTLAEWAHAHGTQTGQPVLLRADGWSVPRQLARLAAESGFTVPTVIPVTPVFRDVKVADKILGLERTTRRAVEAGYFSDQAAEAWLSHLTRGPFFAAVTFYIVVAEV